MYASTIWGGTFESNIHKFEIIQNKAMRKITNVPIFTPMDKICEELGLLRVKDWIRETAINFYNSSKASDYQLIKKLGEYQYDPKNKFRRPL